MKFILLSALFTFSIYGRAEDGYRLWLRYDKISNARVLAAYRSQLNNVYMPGSSAVLDVARKELLAGLKGLLAVPVSRLSAATGANLMVLKKVEADRIPALSGTDYLQLGDEGFTITTKKLNARNTVVITANTDAGLLYGVFHLLRLLQTGQPVSTLAITSAPRILHRVLDHWDNLDRSIERGYAGISLWNWHTLPGYIDQRYIDYARANASIGINGTVLTNVNANSQVLTETYLIKVKALADAFRPYGLKVYLTAKFSAPVDIGGLKTADPLDTAVQRWWKRKADEIYRYIPDFGGFLVKANSEGQPGPQTYNRTHADGANMLADAVAPHGGIIMWRAFVYDVRAQKASDNSTSQRWNGEDVSAADRFKRAYAEFTPLDGHFRKNVIIQVKNGPIDFQPREPFSPLFGAMKQTPVAMELQLTMEYLGQGTHLVYQGPLFKEVLEEDTYAKGKGSTVAKVLDGSVFNYPLTAIAGVSNIGSDRNWTNNPFGQSTWYAFGRLAWDHELTAEGIADEWIRQTFSNDPAVVTNMRHIMLASREAVVNYMTPLGLHHIMSPWGHYGPGPWANTAPRADWNPSYYHRADSFGLGFDRTASGSNALEQYQPAVQARWIDSNTCEEKYLLWFHHVSWQHRMKSGKSLWNELCSKYQQGVDTVKWMQQQWNRNEGLIDEERFRQVQMFLNIQRKEAEWWRNACLLYFQTFSKMAIPANVEKADHTLEYYQNLKFPFAPGGGHGN